MSLKLIVFADNWGRHPSSCQRLLSCLLRRHEALWVNTIGTRQPGWSREDVTKTATTLRQWIRAPRARHDLPANLSVVAPPMWPSNRRGWQRRLNARLISGAVNRALGARRQGELRIALTALPVTADLVGRLDVDRWAYYCVDDFSSWPGLDGETLDLMERKQVHLVDSVIAVSDRLRQRLAGMGREAVLLTHGVDLDYWSAAGTAEAGRLAAGDRSAGADDPGLSQLETRLPAWWGDLARPIMLFWGLIDRRLDVNWCRDLLQDPTRAGTVVLIGPEQAPDPALRGLRGVVRPGPVRYDRLARFAAAADVLIMPYADLPVTRASAPLKFKEYLASGKPVVARALPALREWADAADLVESVGQFVDTVRLRARSGLPESQFAARRRLGDESWESKAAQLEALVLGN